MCVCVGRLKIDLVCGSLSSEHKIGKRLSELIRGKELLLLLRD